MDSNLGSDSGTALASVLKGSPASLRMSTEPAQHFLDIDIGWELLSPANVFAFWRRRTANSHHPAPAGSAPIGQQQRSPASGRTAGDTGLIDDPWPGSWPGATDDCATAAVKSHTWIPSRLLRTEPQRLLNLGLTTKTGYGRWSTPAATDVPAHPAVLVAATLYNILPVQEAAETAVSDPRQKAEGRSRRHTSYRSLKLLVVQHNPRIHGTVRLLSVGVASRCPQPGPVGRGSRGTRRSSP